MNYYWGILLQEGWQCVYGGQVVGQVMVVVLCIVDEDCYVYLLYGYFLCFGDVMILIFYKVDCICDGCSFIMCCVVVVQCGKVIFSMLILFQVDEDGFEYQFEVFDVFDLDFLENEIDLCKKEVYWLFEEYCVIFICDWLIEICFVYLVDLFDLQFGEFVQCCWMCVCDLVGDDLWFYQCVFVYLSDWSLFDMMMWLYGVLYMNLKFQMVLFDYVMWFYCFFCLDDWFFYEQDSLSVSGSCGFNCGFIFDCEGCFVVSVVQEGLM